MIRGTMMLMACFAAEPGPTVTVEPQAGPAVSGRWMGADSSTLTIATEAGTRGLPLDTLARIRFTPQRPAASQPASRWWVVLADGSELAAELSGEAAGPLKLATAYGQLCVPIALVAGLRPPGTADGEFAKALAARGPEDQYLVRQGAKVTVLRGSLEGLGSEGGSFRWKDRSVPVDASRTAGLVLRAAASQPAVGGAVCRTISGEQLRGRLGSADTGRIRWSMGVGGTLELPLLQVAEIDLAAGSGLWLSDLQPASYEHTPTGAAKWVWHKDRSAANRPLRIAGRTYERGIGLHSSCAIGYDLPADARRFTALAGIDDAVRPRGRVELRISLDGREAFRAVLDGHGQPVALDVPVAGAARLEISVGDGGDLDTGDQLDIVVPRVLLK